jgi:predicted nucleic acid-binding protein
MLDSSLVIEAERQHLNVAQFLKQIILKTGEMEAALCSITVAELAHGIYRADNPERRERRRAFLNELKAAVPVYPFGDSTAELAGKIGAESSATGATIPFGDLLIGGMCLGKRARRGNPKRSSFPKDPRLEPDLNLAPGALPRFCSGPRVSEQSVFSAC